MNDPLRETKADFPIKEWSSDLIFYNLTGPTEAM